MSYSIIPLILILLSLAVIIVITAKKFPQLAILDVESIPEVKEGIKKDEFLRKRIDEKTAVSIKDWVKKLVPFIQKLKEIQLRFRKYVGKVESEVLKKTEEDRKEKIKKIPIGKKRSELNSLLKQADKEVENGAYEKAEELYISAIRISPKSGHAYRGLGEVYMRQANFENAEETYQFLRQLDPNDDVTYAKLGHLAERRGDTAKAIEYYEQAVLINDQLASRFVKLAELLRSVEQYGTAMEAMRQAVHIEPQNPKYLDNLTELAILSGDRNLAEESLGQLRMVNPENQKLEILKDKIYKMPT